MKSLQEIRVDNERAARAVEKAKHCRHEWQRYVTVNFLPWWECRLCHHRITHDEIEALLVGAAQPKADHEANARLIAAAPDLLAACEHVLAVYNPDEADAMLEHVRAAVAKARGRAPVA